MVLAFKYMKIKENTGRDIGFLFHINANVPVVFYIRTHYKMYVVKEVETFTLKCKTYKFIFTLCNIHTYYISTHIQVIFIL